MNWYVIYAQAQKEAVAALNLEKQGFETYLPRYNKQCRHARRVYTRQAPLFPRYLFVRMDPQAQRWRAINGTIGVNYLICEGATPVAVAPRLINAIKAREDKGIVQVLLPAFDKGQKLCITDGPFAEIEGLFECVDDQERIVLLLDIMGQNVRTHVPSHAVTAA